MVVNETTIEGAFSTLGKVDIKYGARLTFATKGSLTFEVQRHDITETVEYSGPPEEMEPLLKATYAYLLMYGVVYGVKSDADWAEKFNDNIRFKDGEFRLPSVSDQDVVCAAALYGLGLDLDDALDLVIVRRRYSLEDVISAYELAQETGSDFATLLTELAA